MSEPSEQRRGFLVVISGPSGVGKTTVCGRVLAELEGVRRSVSSTTRAPREGEVHGRDYFFVTREAFEREVAEGRFLEHAEVHGDLYGTHREIVEDLTAQGFDVLLNIDVQGGGQIRRSGMEAVLVFLMPPSVDELERRLMARRTESPEDLERRLAAARNEMARVDDYDHRVVNDDVERAASEVRRIIVTHRGQRSRR